jgi:cytochrome c556
MISPGIGERLCPCYSERVIVMRKTPCVLIQVILLAVVVAAWGCGNNSTPVATPVPTLPDPATMPPGGMAVAGGNTKTKQIMFRIGRGPNALSSRLGKALKAEQPEWETIGSDAAEYAKLASELGTLDPPKGSKESWSKQTTEFAESARALDKAAQAKDLDAAQKAQQTLGGSCMGCHREHRMGPGGPMGPPKGKGGPPKEL